MSTEKAKTIVLEFYKSFDDRNIDKAFAFLDPNFTAYIAKNTLSKIFNRQ